MSALLEYDLSWKAETGNTYIASLLMPSVRNDCIERALARVREPDAPEFDAIAITGVSGIVGALLAFVLDKPLIVVRKEMKQESCHSNAVVEGPDTPCRVLMVDDFVRSGETLKRMQRLLREKAKHTIVGALLYRDHPKNPSLCGHYYDDTIACIPAVVTNLPWVGCAYASDDAREVPYARVRLSPEVSNLL